MLTQNSLFQTVIKKVTDYNMICFKGYVEDAYLEYYAYKYASMQAMLLKKWMEDGMVVEPKKMAEIFMNHMY